MLEIIVGGRILYVFMDIFAAIGILSKIIVNVSLKRLVRAAGNMNKSEHALIRLVRAKFEHACMVSDTVDNVAVFVDKYLYEYRVLGLKLHSWRRMEKMAAGICLLLGAAGAALMYGAQGMSDEVLRVGTAGAVLAIFVYLAHLTTDETYRLQAVKNYMVDYLENVCRRRYEKTHRKEIQVMAPETISSGTPVKQLSEEPAGSGEPPVGLQDWMQTTGQNAGMGGTIPQTVRAAGPVQTTEPVHMKAETPPAPEPEIRKETGKEPEKMPVDRDIRIRQILEEFMA